MRRSGSNIIVAASETAWPIDEAAMSNGPAIAHRALTPDKVRRVCGSITDRKVEDIIDTGADLEALEEAAAWASGDDESTPLRNLPPQSAPGRVYDILMAGEEAEDEERQPPGAG
jgi:hypothetical protein